MNLSGEQLSALETVRLIHEREQREKAELRQQIEAEFAARLAKIAVEKSVAANRAIKLGVPKRQLGLVGLKTSNWGTIQTVLGLAAETVQVESGPEFVLEQGGEYVRVFWVDTPEGRVHGDAVFAVVKHPFVEEWSVGEGSGDVLFEVLNRQTAAWWAEFSGRLTEKISEG